MPNTWLETLIRVTSLLIESRDYKKTLDLIVEYSARLADACRACVVIENERGDLVIKAGFPREGHGIDTTLTPELGEEFLKEVIQRGGVEIVEDPTEDPRTQYMSALARNLNLSKIIFLPLLYHGESLGVLILDFLEDKAELHVLHLEKIKLLANLASSAIGSEYERRRSEEKILRMERLNAIGEESARIAHVFKNAIFNIGPNIRTAKKIAENVEQPSIVERLGNAIGEVERLNRAVDNIMNFSGVVTAQLEPVLINSFLRQTVAMVAGDKRVIFELSSALDEVVVPMDEDLMTHVMNDIVLNAVQAGAGEIKVTTSRNKVEVKIEIANNGEPVVKGIVDDIFSPFETTKERGTGLGLANVRSFVIAHGGNVRLAKTTHEETVFEIYLPL